MSRKPMGERAMTDAERQQRRRQRLREQRTIRDNHEWAQPDSEVTITASHTASARLLLERFGRDWCVEFSLVLLEEAEAVKKPGPASTARR
jgi:hypothetical protein